MARDAPVHKDPALSAVQAHSDPSTARDHQRHDLFNALTVISAQTQLLQRRVLRADRLSTRERELMLGSVTSTMAIAHLAAQLEGLMSDRFGPSGEELVTDPDPSS